MIGGKSYLLCQVWLIPVVNFALESYLASQTLIPAGVKPFLPGLSVGISHLAILLLAWINIPSLSSLMFNQSISKKRRLIQKALERTGITIEHRQHLESELDLLDLTELKRFDIEINAAHSLHSKEMSVDDK
ncbi:hypothetical protein [Serratia liquefaciens]|uniref:Uncharacterized protein n=1 Tax=Serratia liquefaciens TaxID=614 RepID=A0A515CQH8_SERLI|nr:hypothetical protein [Serratia liquefaciens]QDL30424.1 hypothetical protein EGO53_00820 [Serratia liquefaciens]